mgnify:CR=1 FL=1
MVVAYTPPYAGPFETRNIPHCSGSAGLVWWWDSLPFMATDARVRSSWVTFEPSSASCFGQPRRQGASPLE